MGRRLKWECFRGWNQAPTWPPGLSTTWKNRSNSFQPTTRWLKFPKFCQNFSNRKCPKIVQQQSISWFQKWWFTIPTIQSLLTCSALWPFDQTTTSIRSKFGLKNCPKFCRAKMELHSIVKLSSFCLSRGTKLFSKFCLKISTILSLWHSAKLIFK